MRRWPGNSCGPVYPYSRRTALMIRSWSVRMIAILFLLGTALPALAQSQAINGSIEGTVKDSSGAALPGVTVTVTNTDTGAQRVVISGGEGSYRAPLLPLGKYDVIAELSGFKKFEQKGITLSAGQTALINVLLPVGNVSEVITVTGESPIAQPGKIDLGRTIGEAEVKNLPLVSRNPYNFAFLQANVTGYENNEFGVPRINANGSQMHTNYQLDGNTNTEKDRAGLRLLPASEIMVREVKLITSGFAPEFGQTTGMVYNAVTPSGSNDLRGSASYRFRRKAMSERPFFLNPTAKKPDTHVNNYAAPLGLSNTTLPAAGVIPATQSVNFFLGKTDYQLAPDHKLSARYFFFKNESPFNVGGGLNTVDWGTDFH